MSTTDDAAELEIVVTPTAGFADAGGAPVAKAKAAFDSLASTLRDAILPMQQALSLSEHAPSEVEIRLELALKGETKWIVVSTGAQATIGVKLVWKRP